MAVNVSELVSNPVNETFSIFTNMLGNGYYLIPILVVGGGLLLKTKDPVIFGVYLTCAGIFLGGANMFYYIMGAVPLMIVLIAGGLTSLFVGIIYNKPGG